LLMCINNQWAISTPLAKQTAAPSLAAKAEAFGFPGVQVDGNDAVAVHEVTAHARARAVAGDGPTLIEAVTYRLAPHTTSDDPTRYRSQEELDRWAGLDPILRYRRYLEREGLWSERLDSRVVARCKRLRDDLRDALAGAPDID